MKKFLIIAAVIFLSTAINNSFAQGKFSATVTNTSNVLTFSLKPNITTSTGFSDIEFFLISLSTSPTFTWGAVTANTTNFPGMTATSVPGSGSWEIAHNEAAYTIAGYNVDHFIYTAPAPITTTASYTGATEYQLITVPLLGASALVNFTLLDVEPSEFYYLAITDQNGADLRPVSFTNYFYPATSTTPATTYPGTGDASNTAYFIGLTNVPVPIKFTGFSATKKADDGLLSWSAVNENSVSQYYVIQRSFNGVDFKDIANVPVKGGGLTSNTYTYSDNNLSALGSSGTVYYRIQQVDKSGNTTYTEVKALHLAIGAVVTAYPNPAKDIVSLTLDLPEASTVSINLTDAAGKQLQQIQLAGAKGINVNKISLAGYATGSYILKVNSGTEITTLPILKQ